MINAQYTPVNCTMINSLIVNSISLQMGRKQWLHWQELMIMCRPNEKDPLSTLFDLYRSLPMELKEDVPEDEIWLANKVDGNVISKIIQLAV